MSHRAFDWFLVAVQADVIAFFIAVGWLLGEKFTAWRKRRREV